MSVGRKAVIVTILASGIWASCGVCADSRLLWSTFFGGTGTDTVNAVAVDSREYIYIAGKTSSDDFPSLKALQPNRVKSNCGNPGYPRPCYDLFVAKFTPEGRDLVYSTFWGGRGDDVATGLAIDRSDNVYVIGTTTSRDFPVSNSQEGLSGSQDAFVLKLNRSGKLIFSKLIGGEGSEYASSIDIDDNGNCYIAGDTDSVHFPAVRPIRGFGGLVDAFIMKMGPSGKILLSTYLGGTGIDLINSIKVRKNGDIFVGGYTDSTNFPVMNGWPIAVTDVSDGFFAKIDGQALAIQFSTRLGGKDGYDEVKTIALIPEGGAVVAGTTTSTNFPLKNPIKDHLRGLEDGFVTIVNGRNQISFSTYLGGNSYDSVSQVELDSTGNVLITGITHSNNFPTKHPIQLKKNRSEDAFLARMTLHGKLLFSTFIGGDYDDGPRAMKYVTRSGLIYIVGDTESIRFPLINEYQSTNDGVLYWLDGFMLAIQLRQ